MECSILVVYVPIQKVKKKCPASPSMIFVTNVSLVILVMLSNADQNVTENNPLLEFFVWQDM